MSFKRHIKTDSIYQPIKKIINNSNVNNQVRRENNQNKYMNNGHTLMDNNQLNSMSIEQAARPLCRNFNNLFHDEVSADDSVDKENEGSKIKSSSLKNKILSK